MSQSPKTRDATRKALSMAPLLVVLGVLAFAWSAAFSGDSSEVLELETSQGAVEAPTATPSVTPESTASQDEAAVPGLVPATTPTATSTPASAAVPTATVAAANQAEPAPSPTPTVTVAATVEATVTPTPVTTPTAVPTSTPEATPTPTPTVGLGRSNRPSVTATATATAAEVTPTPTGTATATPGVAPTATPTATPPPVTPTAVPSPTATVAPTPTATEVPTPTVTPTPSPLPIGPQPVGQGGSWELLFEDNFDVINRSRWETGWFSDSGFSTPVNDNGGACFHPQQITAVGGAIELRIDPTSDSGCRLKNGDPASFVGALMNTRDTFTFSYGYAEARMFVPGSGGSLHNWPAFWHTGFDWPATGEVDIVEGLSGGQPCAVYHYLENGQHQQDKGCANWPDPTGWHVFAANWEPGRVTYYYDGVKIFETTRGVVGSPHYLILDYTVRANGIGTSVPSSMLVDYVRVWQSAG